jgi:hypothetical protein
MPSPTTEFKLPLSSERDLDRIVSLREASKLRNVSTDTLKRQFPDKIIQLSPRRRGMRLRDALIL